MPKKKTTKIVNQSANTYKAPEFLVDLLNARSPTGHEYEAQAVVDRHVESNVDNYRKDSMGNRFATVNPGGDPSIMFAGHIDELGLIITYIDDNGFVYFDTLGGHDNFSQKTTWSKV
jgi:putative aminopeptidase FrvX